MLLLLLLSFIKVEIANGNDSKCVIKIVVVFSNRYLNLFISHSYTHHSFCVVIVFHTPLLHTCSFFSFVFRFNQKKLNGKSFTTSIQLSTIHIHYIPISYIHHWILSNCWCAYISHKSNDMSTIFMQMIYEQRANRSIPID